MSVFVKHMRLLTETERKKQKERAPLYKSIELEFQMFDLILLQPVRKTLVSIFIIIAHTHTNSCTSYQA